MNGLNFILDCRTIHDTVKFAVRVNYRTTIIVVPVVCYLVN